jgi:TRAP-type uncharacterized transport system fused permease subunit
MSDAIGWMATALTASSYFTRRQALLRRTQACAAALWLVYGAFIHSMPVMTANVIVGGVALWSSFRTPPKTVTAAPSPEAAVGDD